MALTALSTIINVEDKDRRGRLVGINLQGTFGGGQSLIRHEAPTMSLRCVKPALPGSSYLWQDLNIESARAAGGVRFGLGEFDKAPIDGDWPLAFNGDSTGLTALGAAITADQLKTALNANPAISTAGGISSVSLTGRSYRLRFTTAGARANFTSPDNTLTPLSSVLISRAVVGDVDTREVVVITVKRRPYAYCDQWTAAPAASIVVTTPVPGDDAPATDCVQLITLTPGAYDGTATVSLVLPNLGTGDGASDVSHKITLAATDTADELLAKFQAHPEVIKDDVSGISVTGNPTGPYTVTFSAHLKARAIAQMTATNINLIVPQTLTGVLDLNQDAMGAYLDTLTGDSGTLIAELEIQEPGGQPSKPYQDPTWEVSKDVLDGATMRPASKSAYPTPGEIPRYRPTITSLALLAAVPTAAGGLQCLIVNIAGESRWWGLVAGTDATDHDAGIQRPDDFDASTNPYVWKSIL